MMQWITWSNQDKTLAFSKLGAYPSLTRVFFDRLRRYFLTWQEKNWKISFLEENFPEQRRLILPKHLKYFLTQPRSNFFGPNPSLNCQGYFSSNILLLQHIFSVLTEALLFIWLRILQLHLINAFLCWMYKIFKTN